MAIATASQELTTDLTRLSPDCQTADGTSDRGLILTCLGEALRRNEPASYRAFVRRIEPALWDDRELIAFVMEGYLHFALAQECLDVLRRSPTGSFPVRLAKGYCHLGNGAAVRAGLAARRATDAADSVDDIHSARDLYRRSTADRIIDLKLNLQVYPTTNQNRATSTQTVRLFGLPFTVDETQESGIRISTAADLTLRPRLSLLSSRPVVPFLAASIRFDNNLFGEKFIRGRIQPGVLVGLRNGTELIGSYLAGRAYLAGRIVLNEHGLSAVLRKRKGGRTREVFTTATRQDYVALGAQAHDIQIGYAKTTARKYDEFKHGLGVGRVLSESFLLERTSLFAHAGYKRVVFGQAILAGEGQVAHAWFDQDDPTFAAARRDLNSTVELRATPIHLSFLGLSPSLFVRHIRQDSTIPLFDTRASEVGVDLQLLL